MKDEIKAARDFRIPPELIPPLIVLREQALVTLNSAAADVRLESLIRTSRPLDPPRVTHACDKARTWTISGSHATGPNGLVVIHLNKFLDCVSTIIRDVMIGTNDQPVVGGIIYSNFIGSEPSFTATPESDQPVFLTYTIALTTIQPPPQQTFFPEAVDAKITVRSWKHDGSPAPNITFSWIAVARTATVTNF